MNWSLPLEAMSARWGLAQKGASPSAFLTYTAGLVLTLADHIFVFAFAVVYPVYGTLVAMPRIKRAIESGVPGMRLRAYHGTIAGQWMLAAAALLIWVYNGRLVENLGLGWPRVPWRFALGLVIAVGAMLAMFIQARRILRDPKRLAQARRLLERVMFLLPHTPEELRTFRALSVTAGVCEEILFRGFLLWYLFYLVGLWPALILSSLLFGLAHSYQGVNGILRTTLVGLLFALFFFLTLSLWVPILFHAFIDINSGQAAYAIANTPEPEPPPAPTR